ncbi:MAG: hypothetical protein U1E29_09220 [Coriobacteriia bacterium]|nr:hypothetical protein [Coriobacteriia bacterium]
MGSESRGRGIRMLGLSLALLVVLACAGCNDRQPVTRRFKPVSEPVIAVLGTRPPRVVMVGARSLEVLGDVKLRSLSIDIDAAGGDLIVPLCGGPGGSSDTVVAVIRPSAGTVDLIETGRLGPERVASAGRWALGVNSEVLAAGMAGFVLDVADRSVVPVTVPHGPGVMTAVGSDVWLAERFPGPDESLTERLWALTSDREARMIPLPASGVVGLAATEDELVVAGQSPGEEGGTIVRSYRLPGLEPLADVEFAPGERLSGPLSRHGSGIVVLRDGKDGSAELLDSETLEARWTVDGLVGPLAATSVGDNVAVACAGSGEIVIIDARSGSVRKRVRVGEPGFDIADLSFSDPAAQTTRQEAPRDR